MSAVECRKLSDDSRVRFTFVGTDQAAELLGRITGSKGVAKLGDIVSTTSGVGAKSSKITRERTSPRQIKILKGESIQRYQIKTPFFFEFVRENITGRTTDKTKLGFAPKVLIRKTGAELIAAYDDSGTFPEQSLYFTYGESREDLWYVLGLLNSRLMGFVYYHQALTNKESMAQVKKIDLDALPIKRSGHGGEADLCIGEIASKAKLITHETRALLREHTEESRAQRRRRVLAAERDIEQAVRELYGLSEAESRVASSYGQTR